MKNSKKVLKLLSVLKLNSRMEMNDRGANIFISAENHDDISRIDLLSAHDEKELDDKCIKLIEIIQKIIQ